MAAALAYLRTWLNWIWSGHASLDYGGCSDKSRSRVSESAENLADGEMDLSGFVIYGDDGSSRPLVCFCW